MPPTLRTRGVGVPVSNTKSRGGTTSSTAIKRKAPETLRGRPRKMTKAESIDISGWVEGPGPCDRCKDRNYMCRFESRNDGRGRCHQCIADKKGCKIRGASRIPRPRSVREHSHPKASERREQKHGLISAARVSDVPRHQSTRSKLQFTSPAPLLPRSILRKSAKTKTRSPVSSRRPPTQRPRGRQRIRSKGRSLSPDALPSITRKRHTEPTETLVGARNGKRDRADRLEVEIRALRMEYRENEAIIRIKEGRQNDIRAIISTHMREIQKLDGEEVAESKVLPDENDNDLEAGKERRGRTAIRGRQKAYASGEEDDDCVDELDTDDE